MSITRTLTVISIHGETDPANVTDGEGNAVENPECAVLVVAKTETGDNVSFQISDWAEAAFIEGKSSITLTVA